MSLDDPGLADAGLADGESDRSALAPTAAEHLDPLVGDVRSAATVLTGLDGVHVAEHVAHFQHIHEKLQAALTEIDDA
jgi:hypothetical protein